MALIACDECGNQVSDRAASCPKCGNPLSLPLQSSVESTSVGEAKSNEKEIYYYEDERGVLVTSSRIVIFGRTYSLANVSSVGSFTQPCKRTEFFMLAGTMLFFGVIGFTQNLNGCSIFGLVSAGVATIIALLLHDIHFVRITAAGGETNALESKDIQYIKTVVAAISRAIVERG